MKNLRWLLLLGGALTSGCITSHFAPMPENGADTVFFSKLPERPYVELAYVEATGNVFSTRSQLLQKLQQQQAVLQGDALVQVRYDFGFWNPHAGAMIIKYK